MDKNAELIMSFYELALLALHAGDYRALDDSLFCAGMIDLKRRCGIIETRYSDDQPRDEHGRWTDGGSGGYNSGAISGALKPDSEEAKAHAERYYESVRHMTSDTSKISDATGIKKEKIDKIKNHVFIQEHDLIDGRKRFDPSYEMAQSWQRLMSGKNIQEKTWFY